MGGKIKDNKPLAIKLDSGDLLSNFEIYYVLVMSNDSRKCYHGVPRVIAGTYKPKIIEN